MKRQVSIAVFGPDEECRAVQQHLIAFAEEKDFQLQVRLVSDIDELRFCIVEDQPDLVITLADGTLGMEAVYLVRKMSDDLPVFWFSDDKGFGMQSHRLECEYFSVKPATREKLYTAFRGCQHRSGRVPLARWVGGSLT